MSYERVLDSAPASDDCIGRAIWALGVTATLAADEGCRLLARDMLARALPHSRELGPRGTAQAVLGLVSVLAADPGKAEERRMLDGLVAKLRDALSRHAIERLALVRVHAHLRQRDPAARAVRRILRDAASGRRCDVARESLEFLEEVCFDGDHLQLVGNTGWHSSGGEKAHADEQAIDAAAFVLAFSCAYSVTDDSALFAPHARSVRAGSSAPTGSVCRCTISRRAAAATASA